MVNLPSMPELHFFTGTTLSNEAVVAITAGTDAAAFTGAQTAARNRRWELLEAAAAANLPVNPYRRLLIIDNTGSSQDVVIVINGGANPATTLYTHRVEAAGYAEFTRALGEIGPEACSVVPMGTTATACVVTERSAI
jgi:hypothetical protein